MGAPVAYFNFMEPIEPANSPVVIFSYRTYRKTIYQTLRKRALQCDFEAVELLYEDVPDTLSQLIRTAFISRECAQFLVADFSAIEVRVIAWFVGEKWRQDVFAKGGDIYCASAS